MMQLTQPIVQGISTGAIAGGRLAGNHRVRNVRVIPRSLQSGDDELTPAMRLNARSWRAGMPN